MILVSINCLGPSIDLSTCVSAAKCMTASGLNDLNKSLISLVEQIFVLEKEYRSESLTLARDFKFPA